MDDLEIIIDSLGNQNEKIYKDELEDILDEIDSINEDEYFELAKISIEKGKPQILEYLFEIYDFNKSEINILCKEIDYYSESNLDSESDIIIKEFEKIIKNYIKLPYKKGTKKYKVK